MQNTKALARRHVAGIPFDFVSPEFVFEKIEEWRQMGRRNYVEVNNPNAVVCCRRDREMMRATLNAELALPDGVGVVVAALMLGYYRQHRVTGPSLMLYLCDRGRESGHRHYFYGGGAGVTDQLVKQLSWKFPGLKIAGHHAPPYRALSREEDAEQIDRINQAQPDIVWVGLGCPKQEKWMLAHVGRIAAPAMIGVGAAFDFHSGHVKWAPNWIRRCGMEWLFRFAMEPKRMWRRNLRGMQFVGLVMQQSLSRFLWHDFAGVSDTGLHRRLPKMSELTAWVDNVNRWFDVEMESIALPVRIELMKPFKAKKAA